MSPDAALVAVLEAATAPVPAEVDALPARFSLLVRPVHDPVLKREEIRAALAPLGAEVRPLSPLEPQILVAVLPGRVFGTDDGSTFQAAYLMAAAFDLENAEPDLPTNYFPESEPEIATKEPVAESFLRGTPFGCWAPAEPALQPLWALQKVNADAAWAFSESRSRPDRGDGIVIAQPDTGVTAHGELAGVLTSGARDVIDDDDDPTDPLHDLGNPGHGTATASVAVARGRAVVTGSAPRATHMPIRAIQSVVRITQGTVAEAIDWAVGHGAHVITMSLGGIPSFALHRALRRAVAADVIVLAAAGNCVRLVVWPARYDDCIAVGGTNSRDEPWVGSCQGSAIDISAPGENVFRARVASDGNPAGQGQGTSFAVALTAGVAALWLAHHGRANLIAAARARGETLQDMFRRLVRATAKRPAQWDPFRMGAGIVDARALLEADLDRGRDTESAPQPDSATQRAAVAVQSLVMERAGPDALAAPVDWDRYGPEVANALLRAELTAVTGGGPMREETAMQEPVALSPELARVLAGTPLAAHPAIALRVRDA